jgi:hypothetical protein
VTFEPDGSVSPPATDEHSRASLTVAWSGANINLSRIEPHHPIWMCAPLTGVGGRPPVVADDDIPDDGIERRSDDLTEGRQRQ